jgi:hypothetical protein
MRNSSSTHSVKDIHLSVWVKSTWIDKSKKEREKKKQKWDLTLRTTMYCMFFKTDRFMMKQAF